MRLFSLPVLALLLSGLTACAPSGEGPSLDGASTVAGALVCADFNADMACGPGEPSTLTRADGSFTLRTDYILERPTLVLEVQSDRSVSLFDSEPYRNSFPLVFSGEGYPAISVFSSIEHAAVASGALAPAGAQVALAAAFGVPDPALLFSPAVSGEGRAYCEIAETSYIDRYLKGIGDGASPASALVSAGSGLYAKAKDFSKYFARVGTHWLTAPTPPVVGSTPTQIAETHYRAVLLGPETKLGNGLNVPSVKVATTSADADCVEPDFSTLQSVCFNDWTFSFDMVEDINDVVNSIDTSLKVSASILHVATASGKLSWEDYYRSRADSTHAILTAEMRRCKYDLTAKMKPVWEDKFGKDYENFRAGCGDRWLSAQLTGGSFVAVFEKEFTDEQKRKEFKLNLKAKVAGLTVYDHTWKKSADSELSDLDMNIRVVTDRVRLEVPWATLADVTAQFDNFSNMVHSDKCANERGYLDCVYRSSFNLYETTTPVQKAPDENLDLLSGNLFALEQYGADYERLRARVDAILTNPAGYNIGADHDRFTPANDWTLEKLADLGSTLSSSLTTLRIAAEGCRADIRSCTSTPADLGAKSWFQVSDTLPSKKLHVPKDCNELSLYYGSRSDGDYTVYFNRDVTAGYGVKCQGMDTSTPKTLLPLLNTTAEPDQPTANFSSHADADGMVGHTAFDALLLSDELAGGVYKLYAALPDDPRHLKTDLQSPAAEAPGLGGVYNCSASPLSSNLDLTGTPFKLADNVVSTLVTNAAAARVSTANSDPRILTLTLSGGACAYLRPSPSEGRLPLILDK